MIFRGLRVIEEVYHELLWIDRSYSFDRCLVCAVVMNDGLQEKFNVSRVDGKDQPGGTKENARYFVLDYVHDVHARDALSYYAHLVREDYPQLSRDLITALAETR